MCRYEGHHTKGEEDGKWVTYKDYAFNFSGIPLQNLRISPNAMDALMACQEAFSWEFSTVLKTCVLQYHKITMVSNGAIIAYKQLPDWITRRKKDTAAGQWTSRVWPVSWKPRKLFGPVKPFLVHLYLKTEKFIRLKLLVWRETLFILRMWE